MDDLALLRGAIAVALADGELPRSEIGVRKGVAMSVDRPSTRCRTQQRRERTWGAPLRLTARRHPGRLRIARCPGADRRRDSAKGSRSPRPHRDGSVNQERRISADLIRYIASAANSLWVTALRSRAATQWLLKFSAGGVHALRGGRSTLVDPGESTGFQIRLDLHAFLLSGLTGLLYFRPQGRPTILPDRNVGSTCAVGGHAHWETFGYASQRKDDRDHHRRRRFVAIVDGFSACPARRHL